MSPTRPSPTAFSPAVYEAPGAFYLGATPGSPGPRPLLYDSRDLTTHGVILGMTGSGKTGLGVGLLEEAALDGIPAIILDPKGDMGNLALRFPELEPGSFLPWVDPGAAARAGRSVEDEAAALAARWRQGLADWGQGPARLARLRKSAEVRLYTPGGRAGAPLAVLRSFQAPPPEVLADFEALQQRLAGTVQGLLTLLGLEVDPFTSVEVLLLTNLLQHHWYQGRDLGLASLIREIQAPPFQTLGVMDLETVFPTPRRMALSMRLNALLASPAFSVWTEGEPLDIERLLHDWDGRPRHSILCLSHLSESQRMFFVTVLLGELIAWMRRQPGTSGLRALLYMDEVFGYLPPVAEPPSKRALLTLLKQARAYGLGVVLSTQNPVDLDYKALSNTGSWFLGRLQTERDVDRVLDGLEGVPQPGGAAFDRAGTRRLLAGLEGRQFLLRNVHEDAPALFRTRWALSYLRGPLTSAEVSRVHRDSTPQPPAGLSLSLEVHRGPLGSAPGGETRSPDPGPPPRPLAPPEVVERFVPPDGPAFAGERLEYRPSLLLRAEVHYVQARSGVDHWEDRVVTIPLHERCPSKLWPPALSFSMPLGELASEPLEGARFLALPAGARKASSYPRWQKTWKDELYRNARLVLRTSRKPKILEVPGEVESVFGARLREACRELRDLEVEKLRTRYRPKLARLEERIRRAEEKVEVQQEQVDRRKREATLSVGSTLLGALFGRKLLSRGNLGRATSSMRAAGRISKEKQDVVRARERVEDLQDDLLELEEELQEQIERLRYRYLPEQVEVREVSLKPRKADIRVQPPELVWFPFVAGEPHTPAWDAHGRNP